MSKKYPTTEDMIFALQTKRNGPILKTESLACQFGEFVLRSAKDDETVQQQLPLKAIDQGDVWLISGAPEISKENPGPWQMTVNKADCQIRFINDYTNHDKFFPK